MRQTVAVVIVNWNCGRFLDACLSALVAQTVAPHEIILVDNASSDASLGIISRFPSVRLFAQNENHGFARGNNLAILAASVESEWIALLNPDAFPEPRWLEELLNAARDYSEYVAFGSRLVVANAPAVLDGAGDAYHFSGVPRRLGHGAMVSSVSAQAREVFSPCAAAALYRRSALQEVGGFDEDFFCYVEDVDLGFRLRLAGYRCLYVPHSVAHHVGSGTTGGQHSDFSVYHGHRNLVWCYVKNMPGALFWLFLPVHIVMNIMTFAFLAVRRQGGTALRAKRDAIKGIPAAWRKRAVIQARRRVSARDIWRVLDKGLLVRR